MIGCLLTLFLLIWKIAKLAVKIVWKVLRFLLFRCGLIFVALFVLGAFIIDKVYAIGLSPAGEMQVWYYAGLGLSVVCTAIVFVRNAVKGGKKK